MADEEPAKDGAPPEPEIAPELEAELLKRLPKWMRILAEIEAELRNAKTTSTTASAGYERQVGGGADAKGPGNSSI